MAATVAPAQTLATSAPASATVQHGWFVHMDDFPITEELGIWLPLLKMRKHVFNKAPSGTRNNVASIDVVGGKESKLPHSCMVGSSLPMGKLHRTEMVHLFLVHLMSKHAGTDKNAAVTLVADDEDYGVFLSELASRGHQVVWVRNTDLWANPKPDDGVHVMYWDQLLS
ncbi:hypothetical protein HDU80_001827 [Chytriomyces hyalinus]|nr:hypothetical protein HDU80_001827 [Chytriomyces hyalinus]